jgi:hypothetical protein
MLHHPRFQFAQAFSGVGGSVCTAIIMLHCDTFDNSPEHLVQIADFGWSRSISLEQTLVIAAMSLVYVFVFQN